MTENDIVYVAVAPSGTLQADLIRKAAGILNKDLPDMRLLLAAGMPRIAGRYSNARAAEEIAHNLSDAGLAAIVCTRSELYPPSAPLTARQLEFGDGHVTARDIEGRTRRMTADSVSLILEGMNRSLTRAETITTRMKFSLPATLLAGGIPIWRRVKEKSQEASLQAESFVRVYGPNPSEPSVDILEYHVDYSCLGTHVAPSSLTNFNTTAKKLRSLFPQAAYDDTLTRPTRPSAPTARIRDDTETVSRLIYLFCLAGRRAPG